MASRITTLCLLVGTVALLSCAGPASADSSEEAHSAELRFGAATADRTNSPVFNVWEYVRGAGSINSRTEPRPSEFESSGGGGLNRCEWAIISCCPTVDSRRRHDCFESLHCSGAWFSNPCTQRLQAAVFNRLMGLDAGVKG